MFRWLNQLIEISDEARSYDLPAKYADCAPCSINFKRLLDELHFLRFPLTDNFYRSVPLIGIYVVVKFLMKMLLNGLRIIWYTNKFWILIISVLLYHLSSFFFRRCLRKSKSAVVFCHNDMQEGLHFFKYMALFFFENFTFCLH